VGGRREEGVARQEGGKERQRKEGGRQRVREEGGQEKKPLGGLLAAIRKFIFVPRKFRKSKFQYTE
jgi:hypothetical protein